MASSVSKKAINGYSFSGQTLSVIRQIYKEIRRVVTLRCNPMGYGDSLDGVSAQDELYVRWKRRGASLTLNEAFVSFYPWVLIDDKKIVIISRGVNI